MNDWAKVAICISIVLLVVGTALGITIHRWSESTARNTELEKLNQDLNDGNRELSAGIADARAAAERNAEQAYELRAEIRSVIEGSTRDLASLNKITDRAKRINALARLIDKTLEDLIKANNFMADTNLSGVSSSSK